MIFPSNRVRVLVLTQAVDFRKGHDGLAAIVSSALRKDPFTRWSTSKTVAEKFAAGFRGHRHQSPVLAFATRNIDQVSLVTNSREEFEIIVDPYQFDGINVTRLA
jgi:hypothetical protein